MAIKKVTGDPGIDAIIGSLEKQFSKENMITLGPSRKPIGAVPTGALGLDIHIGIGGVPRGRITEIFGPESSGKTSIALSIAYQYEQHKASWGHDDRWVLIVDVEHSITIEQIAGIGLDPDRLIFVSPDTGEEALQTILNLVKSERIGLAVFDSIDAVQTESQLKKKMGENEMGGASKILNRFMREFSKVCKNTDTTVIFLNQLKYNPGAMFGSPEVTPGGTGLKFYASLRLKTMPGKPSDKQSGAFRMRVKIIKNKVSPPRSDPAEFDFIYIKGPDPCFDLVTVSKNLGIGKLSTVFSVLWPGDSDFTTISKGGLAGAIEFLRANPDVQDRLRTVCLNQAANG